MAPRFFQICNFPIVSFARKTIVQKWVYPTFLDLVDSAFSDMHNVINHFFIF